MRTLGSRPDQSAVGLMFVLAIWRNDCTSYDFFRVPKTRYDFGVLCHLVFFFLPVIIGRLSSTMCQYNMQISYRLVKKNAMTLF
jgi:hypothetical protein